MADKKYNYTIKIADSTDSISLSTGALTIAGGAAFNRTVSFGKDIGLFGSNTGKVSIIAPTDVTSYTLTLPSSLPTVAGYALVSDTSGKLSFAQASGGGGGGGSGSGLVTTTATGLNNQATPADVAGLVITKSQFFLYITTTIVSSVAANSSTTLYRIEGTKQPAGTFDLNIEEIGPSQRIVFSILPSGQLQYTSPDITGWTGTTFTIQVFDSSFLTLMSSQTMQTVNNQAVAANVTGLIANTNQFAYYVTATVTSSVAANSVSALYLLEGVRQPNGTFAMTTTRTGPDAGFTFTILPSGQVQYTSSNVTGWTAGSLSYLPAPASYNGEAFTTVVKISNTTPSTSAVTGALQVGGGVGVSGDLNIGGNLLVSNTVDSTSTTTGALIVSGGAAVAKTFTQAGCRSNTLNVGAAGSGWFRIGTFSGPNGSRLKLTLVGSAGFDNSLFQSGGETIIYASVNNNASATVANIGGMWLYIGSDSSILSGVKFVQTANRNTYQVLINVNWYSNHTVLADTTSGATFTQEYTAVADPGVNSATVQAATMARMVLNTPVAVPITSFSNGWGPSSDTAFNVPRCYKTAEGLVLLSGLITSGTFGGLALTLPVGYRPQYATMFACLCTDSTTVQVNLYNDGRLLVFASSVTPSNLSLSLDNIRFIAYP